MTNREWWPAFMADEGMPQPETSPTDWVREALGDRWLIAERLEDRFDDESIRQEIAPGETMDFIFRDARPSLQMRVNADGSYQIVNGTDYGANNFVWLHDYDFMAPTLAELAVELAEAKETGVEEILACYWSDEIPHRFEIGAEGPRFVPLPEDAGAKP